MTGMHAFLRRLAEAFREVPNQPLFPRQVGHHAYRIVIAAYGLMLTQGIVEALVPVETAVSKALSLTLLTVMMWTYVCLGEHNRGLCERCVGEMPLDGPQKAEQWRRSLRVAHQYADHAIRWAVIVGVLVVGGTTLEKAGLVPSLVMAFVYAAPIVLTAISLNRHKQVQPWCPQCRSGGRGPRERSPQPMPVPALSR